MRSFSLYLAFGLLCGPIAAQDIVVTPLLEAETEDVSPLQPLDELIGELTTIPFDDEPDGPTFGPSIDVLAGVGGQLRVLDKLTGVVTDMELTNGEVGELGFLTVTLQECRYPSDNPAGDAFAFVEVQDSKENIGLFSGWIIASAPALNAMDHPRYDVWALRCTMSAPDDT